MKKILLAVLGISMIAVTAEAPSAMGQLAYTMTVLAVMAISALVLNHIDKKEVE
jgi:hypothetical protein